MSCQSLKKTSFNELTSALRNAKPSQVKNIIEAGSQYRRVCMDEVHPGIYVGDESAARNRDYLKQMGITHVVNTAESSGSSSFATVSTNADFYKDYDIEYIGLKLFDIPSANIAQYFEPSAEFIDKALSKGGKILVHCFMGISRSATITAAFLMTRRGMSAVEALTQIRERRFAVWPNDGFLQSLADLNNKIMDRKTSQ